MHREMVSVTDAEDKELALDRPEDVRSEQPRPVSVIDIGTTTIRMTIAEISPEGGAHTLESLSQPVNLGKDTFTTGSIRRSTIKDCVRILKNYGQILRQYRIDDEDRIRVVATTAVSEAGNQATFLDRIRIGTGFQVEVIDDAELSRLTFLGILPLIDADPELKDADVLVVKIGGGSTATLHIKQGDVAHSHSFRQGTYRLRRMLERFEAPVSKVRDAMQSHVQRLVDRIRRDLPEDGTVELLALGKDVRVAASQMLSDWDQEGVATLPVAELERFTEEILPLTVEEISSRYSLPIPDAETLAPALLTWTRLAYECSCQHIGVVAVTMRDGLLEEMTVEGAWTRAISRQIVQAALDLGRRFEFDEEHALHVAELSVQLFQELSEEHQLPRRYEMLLYVGALLHDIGYIVNTTAHHKHAMYLILNSGLFGLGSRDLMLVALLARYHRRAIPKATHEGYATLDAENRLAVAKLAAILRVADALDRSYSQRIKELECTREGDRLVITASSVDDLFLEQLAVRQKGPMFEDVYGLQVQLRRT